jgi:hypothetical protein
MTDNEFEKLLGAALTRQNKNADDAAVNRVLKRLAGPLPRQKVPLWRLPAVLLDWQFAPAWPRLAALGACAAVGFFIGIAGIDRGIDGFNLAANNGTGFGSIVFEPEALTGAQP